MLPLAHAPAWIVASALLVAAVLYLSLAPIAMPPMPTNFDKLEHAVAYVLLAVWFTGLVERGRYWLVVLGLVALGLAVEYLQHAMPFGRQADPWDMVANVIGTCVGIALALSLTGGWAIKVEQWLGRN